MIAKTRAPVQRVPRVAPGRFRQIGLVGYVAARLGSIAAGTSSLHLFTTLGRHKRLFWRWLVFASGLMPGGKLPRAETELIILRVANLTGCAYEWSHHVRLARRAGIGYRAIAHVRKPTISSVFSPRIEAMFRAADELHEQRTLSEPTWLALRAQLDECEAIELCMLVGHYEMLAMLLNGLQVQRDAARR